MYLKYHKADDKIRNVQDVQDAIIDGLLADLATPQPDPFDMLTRAFHGSKAIPELKPITKTLRVLRTENDNGN